MLNEFKAFIARGNVLDLAVGVIIGAIIGSVDFSNLFIPLSSKVTATSLAAAREQGAVFAYGNFITIVINFLIIAWCIFMLIKAVNRLMPKKEENPVTGPSEEVQLLTQIRDELKAKNGTGV